MGKGKGDSKTQTIKLPKELEQAATALLGQAQGLTSVGYMPYNGNTVAGLTPAQTGAMDNNNAALRAFGLSAPTGTGLPKATVDASGVSGYSGLPAMEAGKAAIPKGQLDALMSYFIDPKTGVAGVNATAPGAPQPGGGKKTGSASQETPAQRWKRQQQEARLAMIAEQRRMQGYGGGY